MKEDVFSNGFRDVVDSYLYIKVEDVASLFDEDEKEPLDEFIGWTKLRATLSNIVIHFMSLKH